MSNARFELTGDDVDVVEDVWREWDWTIEDSCWEQERRPVFTFSESVGPISRSRIVALLNDNIATLAAPPAAEADPA